MRVVLVQDHLRNGGTEQQAIAIAEGLASRDFDAHLVIFKSGGALDSLARAKPFHLHFLPQGPLKFDWFAPGLSRLLAQIHPDVVIPMGRMANCYAGLLCRNGQRSYKIIATCRTGRQLPFLYRRALQGADHLVTNSREALRRLEQENRIRRPETSTVIYNGCIRDFELTIPSFRPHPSGPRLHLCSVSMFRQQKQQIQLVRICSQLPERLPWRLTLAGDGPCRTACEAEAKNLGLADRVHFPGLLKDPRALYFDSDIAVHASDRESLPNFLVEAQMAGLPVVAYDVNGVGETIRHGESGFLIPHGNPTAFMESVTRLADDAPLRSSMSAAAKQHANARFTLAAQTDAYAKLIASLRPDARKGMNATAS